MKNSTLLQSFRVHRRELQHQRRIVARRLQYWNAYSDGNERATGTTKRPANSTWRSTMKNQLRRLLVTIGLSAVLGSSLLNAQVSGKIGVSDVPFSFRIADRVLPPGNYTVTAHSNGLMELWNRDNKEGIMFVAGSNTTGKSDPKLVFDCY